MRGLMFVVMLVMAVVCMTVASPATFACDDVGFLSGGCSQNYVAESVVIEPDVGYVVAEPVVQYQNVVAQPVAFHRSAVRQSVVIRQPARQKIVIRQPIVRREVVRERVVVPSQKVIIREQIVY